MTTTPIRTRPLAARPARREVPTHLFAIGQAVRFRGGFGQPAALAEIYHVTRTLPPRGDSPQYRIRNDEERHERVTSQSELEAIRETSTDASLIERTFGHG
ncbi:hypothetical protein ABGN05_25215 [Aquibium sp. LZ166]|uniref:Uncharacterized protein n=1 Tax=Aquibium pacificus TaxID=3153579 RepID=A0ABV3SQ67_9HYPH